MKKRGSCILTNKTVLLCITGSIAAYKGAEIASLLVKQHATVYVLMTKNATKFITPLTFQNLTHNQVICDMFDNNFKNDIEHISLAQKADIVLVAPSTANIIAKLSMGIADDMVSTTILACTCPKLIAPAMNTAMLENPVTKRNLNTLTSFGWEVLPCDTGLLACGVVGNGKLLSPEKIVEEVIYNIAYKKDLEGKTILVTAGPTWEAIDPVRYLTNYSTGKMGYAIAKAASMRGANVTLISGPVKLDIPSHINFISVVSAEDMFTEVTKISDKANIIIKAAAVSDYRPVEVLSEKKKKYDGENSTLQLERTKDILSFLGEHSNKNQFICGFAMESENLLENAKEKLLKKNVDMICANSLRQEGAGFANDTNILTLLLKDKTIPLSLCSKDECAHHILDTILENASF